MSSPEVDQVRIRRVPKFGVFIALGAVVGAIVSFVLTSLYPADPTVGFAATFAYVALFGVTAGAVVGAAIAILLDRLLARRAKTVAAERDVVAPPEDEPIS